ncbi:MAG: hypothetical protein VB106_17130 [Clostridiaceae bacterium]|nr:hypothetical protein [Clostridiaceae bacterium]
MPNDPLSLNLYTYCHDDPINNADPTGHVINLVAAAIGAAVGAAINVGITAIGDYLDDGQLNSDWKVYAGAAASGAIGGAAAGFTMGGSLVVQVAANAAIGAATSAAGSAAEQAIVTGHVDMKTVGNAALFGGIAAGLITGLSGSAGSIKKAASKYEDVTLPDSRFINKATNVTKAEFGENLGKNNWNSSVTKDGKAIIYQKGGAKYVLRDAAKSTGGPTADYYKAGSKSIDIKIRLR